MKKAQAASEFLVTYGFAILGVIVAISAISYFGVFNNTKIIEKCQSSFGMDCVDKAAINSSGVRIALRQNLGFRTEIKNLTSDNCNVKKVVFLEK